MMKAVRVWEHGNYFTLPGGISWVTGFGLRIDAQVIGLFTEIDWYCLDCGYLDRLCRCHSVDTLE